MAKNIPSMRTRSLQPRLLYPARLTIKMQGQLKSFPNKRNPKRPTARHIIIKMAKFQDKEKILKAAREKQEVTYKEAPIRLATDFSMETLQARREWQKYSKY